jgi:cupin 2 domain-containing protein
MGNIFENREVGHTELFESLFENKNVKIERIISPNSSEPLGEWYNQENDEWVLLIQGHAKIEFENNKTTELASGDYIFIPKHTRHRVISTHGNPECIWLAIHIQ